MNLPLEMRNTALLCSNVDHRALLREVADELSVAMREFHSYPSHTTLGHLTGLWAHGLRVLNATPPEGEPSPLSGSPEPARLAA